MNHSVACLNGQYIYYSKNYPSKDDMFADMPQIISKFYVHAIRKISGNAFDMVKYKNNIKILCKIWESDPEAVIKSGPIYIWISNCDAFSINKEAAVDINHHIDALPCSH
jgi:hypothetical protein